MTIETRLYVAVSDTRKAMRAGQPAHVAAASFAALYDVPYADTLRLAALAESECTKTREALAIEHAHRQRELERARDRLPAGAQPEAMP